jgi:hypothetical protein
MPTGFVNSFMPRNLHLNPDDPFEALENDRLDVQAAIGACRLRLAQLTSPEAIKLQQFALSFMEVMDIFEGEGLFADEDAPVRMVSWAITCAALAEKDALK